MNSLLGNIKSLAKCPVCQKRYSSAAVPLSEDETRSAFYVSCSTCGVSSILFVSLNQWGIASVGVLTDLDGEEARKYLGQDIVSIDHVLDAYVSLGDPADRLTEML